MQLYADDIQIYYSFSVHDTMDAQNKINFDLSKVSDWCKQNSLILNPNKCKHILFHKQDQCLAICLNGSHLEPVDSAKDLGLIIDSKLKFTEHVKNSLRNGYYKLKHLFSFKSDLDTKTKIMLIESLVLSNLNYCDTIVGPCLTADDKHKLQKLQNLSMKFITSIPRFAHVTPYIRQFELLKMQERRFVHFCCLVYNILKFKLPAYLDSKLVRRNEIHERILRHVPHTLDLPHHRTTGFCSSFSYLAPHVYNALPVDLFQMSYTVFKKKIINMIKNNELRINLNLF